MPKYEDGKATDNPVLLAMTPEEAETVRSLLSWCIGNMVQDAKTDQLSDVHARLRKLIPSPGPTLINIG